MKRHSRHRKKKKLQNVFGLLAVAVLAVFCLILLLKDSESKMTLSSEKETVSASEEESISYEGKEYIYNDHLSNYLFLGIDTREEVDSYDSQSDAGQADAIFLISLDRVKKTIQVLSIPRDTITEIEAFNPSGKSLGKTKDHINLQYAFGDGKHESCNLMRDAVSALLYDIPIQGYCSLNMDGIPALADLAGGVEIIVPDDSLSEVYPEFYEGASVTLTAENMESFLRFRDTSVFQSALVRQEHQKVFLEAYLTKAQKLVREDASFLTKLYEELQPYMVTNMGNDLFGDLMEAAGNGVLRSENLPGEGVYRNGYDEYLADTEAIYELVLEMYYKEK